MAAVQMMEEALMMGVRCLVVVSWKEAALKSRNWRAAVTMMTRGAALKTAEWMKRAEENCCLAGG